LRAEKDSTSAGSLAERLARLMPPKTRRVLIYGCVGLAVSIFYSLAVIGCVALLHPISPTLASIVAFVVTVPGAYLAHAKVSFSDRAYDRLQPLRFALSTTTSFIVSIGGMYWITEVAGRGYLFGIAWNWLTIPAMNFLSYVFWVFRAAGSPSSAGQSESSTVGP
jgi:putative flippase GtrA